LTTFTIVSESLSEPFHSNARQTSQQMLKSTNIRQARESITSSKVLLYGPDIA